MKADAPKPKAAQLPKAEQDGGKKAAQPADLKDEGLAAPKPSAAIKEATKEVKTSSVDTADQANKQVICQFLSLCTDEICKSNVVLSAMASTPTAPPNLYLLPVSVPELWCVY